MKRNMISFFTLLFLTIVAVTVFIVLISKDKKAQQGSEDALTNQVVTNAPTAAAIPTITPEPTTAPYVTELYPAFQTTDNVTKYGYIDKSGNFVIQPSFDTASEFHDKVAVVRMDDENYIIDEKGNIINTSNDEIFDFCNGAAIFMVKGGSKNLYGYIDTEGQTMIEAKYEAATNFNPQDIAYVKTGDLDYAMIDKTGKILENYTLDKKYKNCQLTQDGYLILPNKKSVIDMKGEVVLKPNCNGIRYLGNNLFAVEKKSSDNKVPSKEAIFNDKGEQLTDYNYYDIGEYYNGYACATDDTSTFFLDISGNKAADLPVYDGIGTMKLFDDVIEADIENQLIYSTTNKSIFWQEDNSIALSDSITVRRMITRPSRFEQILYPQLEGLPDETVQNSINQELKQIFINSHSGNTVNSSTEGDVKYGASLLNDVLIIEDHQDNYSFDAINVTPAVVYYFIDIKTGVFYQFKDLFLDGSDYVTKINGMISDEINADSSTKNSTYYNYNFKGISDPPLFSLDKDAMVIYLPPNNITSLTGELTEFIIPFVDIEDYINQEGAFWNSLQGTE